jgi:hypothetical protein
VDERGKRLHRQRVSLNDAEMAELRERAQADGRSVADFVYRLVTAPPAGKTG